MERVTLDIVCDRCGANRSFHRESERGDYRATVPDAGLIRGAGWRHLTYRDYGFGSHHAESETMTVCPRCIKEIQTRPSHDGVIDPPGLAFEIEPVAGSDETVAGPIQTVAEGLAQRSAWDDYPIPRFAMADVWRATGRAGDLFEQLAARNTPADTWAEVVAGIRNLRIGKILKAGE